jgi:hypothetical protein
MATEALIIVATVINLVAFGGFAYWARGWFTSLKGTVDTQAKTITALQSVVDATDWPKMLDRIQAYRKFVDQEKEVIIADLQRRFAEERKLMASGTGIERLKACEEFLGASTEFLFELLSYVPRENRHKLIDASNFDEKAKFTLRDAANKFPDQSMPGLMGALGVTLAPASLAATGITSETRLSEIPRVPPEKKR